MILMMLVMAFPMIGLGVFFLEPWTVALPIYLAAVGFPLSTTGQ